MNPTLVGYVGFVVAALILIWAVFEMSRRLTRRKKIDAKALNTLDAWVKLDSTRSDGSEVVIPPVHTDNNDDDDGEDDIPESNLPTRAQQNGHYSEIKKPL